MGLRKSKLHGQGVFATRLIKKGTILTSYPHDVLDLAPPNGVLWPVNRPELGENHNPFKVWTRSVRTGAVMTEVRRKYGYLSDCPAEGRGGLGQESCTHAGALSLPDMVGEGIRGTPRHHLLREAHHFNEMMGLPKEVVSWGKKPHSGGTKTSLG